MNEEEKQSFIDKIRSELMDTTEAADKLGFSSTGPVNTLIQRGKIPAVKIGRREWFIFRDDFKDYAANRPGKGGRPKKEDQ